MRVLLISQTSQSRTEGQPKSVFLSQIPGVDLCLLVPHIWNHYGKPKYPETPEAGNFRFEVGQVRWHSLPGAQHYLHYYPKLSRLLREFKPDIIDLWEEPWGLVSAQVCWLRDRICPNAKIISETEQNLFKVLPPPFEMFRKYVFSKADFVVGRSREAVEVAQKKGFTGPSQVVPNAMDTDIFRPLDRPACREKLLGNIPSGRLLAGYVGRLVPEKGLEDMVEALQFCDNRVDLVLVGGGEMGDALLEKAKTLGVGERVRIFPPRPLQELGEVMNALDVLLLVSRTTPRWKEQFGRVIIEAQACETPVIGSDSGAIPDVVGQGGMIVPEQNPRAMADALLKLEADRSLGRTMGKIGRDQALAHCTWQKVAQQMAGIYFQVAGLSS